MRVAAREWLFHAGDARGFRHLDRAVDAGRRAAEEALASGGKDALELADRKGVSEFIAEPATV
jgi:hypothetical protein